MATCAPPEEHGSESHDWYDTDYLSWQVTLSCERDLLDEISARDRNRESLDVHNTHKHQRTIPVGAEFELILPKCSPKEAFCPHLTTLLDTWTTG